MLCPVIEINTTFYNLVYNSKGVTIEEVDAFVERNQYIKTESSTNLICKSVFESHIEMYKKRKTIKSSMNHEILMSTSYPLFVHVFLYYVQYYLYSSKTFAHPTWNK